MTLSELKNLLANFKLSDEVCLQIKTNITTGSGERISFIYEIKDINTVMQIGDNSIISITAEHVLQTIRTGL